MATPSIRSKAITVTETRRRGNLPEGLDIFPVGGGTEFQAALL
jgi:hypothetical protein